LYGCENCSLALREGLNLKVLRDSNIGPKREGRENCVMKILMITIFIAKYYSGDEIRRMKSAGITASEEEKRDAYRVLVIKPEEKRSLGRYRRELANNIKLDLRK
jgi:hypothetical protein